MHLQDYGLAVVREEPATDTLTSAEYTAKYNVNETVPYTTYESYEGVQTVISPTKRGDIRPGFELIVSHYADIKGLNASTTCGQELGNSPLKKSLLASPAKRPASPMKNPAPVRKVEDAAPDEGEHEAGIAGDLGWDLEFCRLCKWSLIRGFGDGWYRGGRWLLRTWSACVIEMLEEW